MTRLILTASLAALASAAWSNAHVSISSGGMSMPSATLETSDADDASGVSVSVSNGATTLNLNSFVLPDDAGSGIDPAGPLPSLNDLIPCAGPSPASGCDAD